MDANFLTDSQAICDSFLEDYVCWWNCIFDQIFKTFCVWELLTIICSEQKNDIFNPLLKRHESFSISKVTTDHPEVSILMNVWTLQLLVQEMDDKCLLHIVVPITENESVF